MMIFKEPFEQSSSDVAGDYAILVRDLLYSKTVGDHSMCVDRHKELRQCGSFH